MRAKILTFAALLVFSVFLLSSCISFEPYVLPIGVIFVSDTSGSMARVGDEDPMEDSKESMRTFIELMDVERDKAALIEFDTDYRVAFDYGPIGRDDNDSGVLDILEEIDKLSASGTTLLWKSTYVGLEMAIENNHDYASMGLLVFTDGEDNQSGNTDEYWVDKISEKAKNEGIPIFTVGLDQEGWAYNPEPLEELAERTGGMFFDTPDSEELEKIYEELFEVTEKRAVEGFL